MSPSDTNTGHSSQEKSDSARSSTDQYVYQESDVVIVDVLDCPSCILTGPYFQYDPKKINGENTPDRRAWLDAFAKYMFDTAENVEIWRQQGMEAVCELAAEEGLTYLAAREFNFLTDERAFDIACN